MTPYEEAQRVFAKLAPTLISVIMTYISVLYRIVSSADNNWWPGCLCQTRTNLATNHYDRVTDVVESFVFFANKILTHRRMH